MKKYSLILLPVLLGVWISGCDSQCCSKVEPAVDNKAPVALINLNGIQVNGECTPGINITLTPGSTDSDGSVTDNIWKVDGTEVGNTTVTCPDAGTTKNICLTAVDNDGKKSQEVCKTITGKAQQVTQATPPASIIKKGTTFNDGQEFTCDKVHDTDTIHTYPNDIYLYGSNTPKDIKEITWKYTYHNTDGSVNTNTKTQSQYNQDEGKDAGYCTKWFHTDDVKTIDFTITTVDDDQQTTATNYTFDVGAGTLTKK